MTVRRGVSRTNRTRQYGRVEQGREEWRGGKRAEGRREASERASERTSEREREAKEKRKEREEARRRAPKRGEERRGRGETSEIELTETTRGWDEETDRRGGWRLQMLERSHCKGPEKCTCLVFIGLPERRAPATGYGLRATTKTKTKTRTKTRTRTRTTTTTTTKTTTTHDHDHDPRPRPRPRNHENHDRDGYDHDGDERREGVKVGIKEGRAGRGREAGGERWEGWAEGRG